MIKSLQIKSILNDAKELQSQLVYNHLVWIKIEEEKIIKMKWNEMKRKEKKSDFKWLTSGRMKKNLVGI